MVYPPTRQVSKPRGCPHGFVPGAREPGGGRSMSSVNGGTTRRRLLEGAAGVAAAGALSGTGPALAEAARKHHHRHRPLWQIAQQRGIVYGGSISTWMYADDPAYAHLFRRQVAMLWPEDDFLWYHLRPSPT